ncbi:hypothetical protein [Reinekea sp. G2M2-21]|uniref:hypothetical protein n=1 Tax=Reinekea sp. G2M2-21 TaxID=2788942 RepID=UPI0018A98EF9|nr:hypothetical protein [Reinekea sp. G2M2-21]
MKQVGVYLLIAGIGSILLNQFGYEFSLLMWIDNWGETVGWAIRGSAVVAGVILLVLGMKAEQKGHAEEVSTD